MAAKTLRKVNYGPIRNSKGEPIRLTESEAYHAAYVQRRLNERFANDLEYEIPITTLTQVQKKVCEQKFFEVAPAAYVPIRVGENAWNTQLTTFRSFEMGDNFETGIINTGTNNTRLAQADVAVDAVNVVVINWAKSLGWSIPELQQAAKSGNWDIVSAKEKSRKKNWDLGIQRCMFLGPQGYENRVFGLLNQPGITVNTTVITKPISSMNATELSAFSAAVINAYRQNNDRTAFPTHFIMPESDYLGMASQASPDYPLKNKLDLIREMFAAVTQKPDFKVLPLAYADASTSSYTYQQYVLLNYDEDSIRADIPVDYTPTLANSIDGFSFQNAAYGQFTGVMAYRPRELLYFQYTPS